MVYFSAPCQSLFSTFDIIKVQEMNLAANQRREDMNRLIWQPSPGESLSMLRNRGLVVMGYVIAKQPGSFYAASTIKQQSELYCSSICVGYKTQLPKAFPAPTTLLNECGTPRPRLLKLAWP